MASLGGVDLGTVSGLTQIVKRTMSRVKVGSMIGAISQDLISEDRSWSLDCRRFAPTQIERDRMENLWGEIVLLDAVELGLFGYVKVSDIKSSVERRNYYNYGLQLDAVNGIGVTYVQSTGVVLHDLDYRRSVNVFDPHFGRFGVNYSVDRLSIDHSFYLDNDNAAITSAILEVTAGDDLSMCEVSAWKAAAWTLVGQWGGADAWGDSKNFTDDLAAVHVFKLNKGLRGAAVTGIGTNSMMLGCNNRVLCSVTNLLAQAAADLSTDYGNDQLFLKVKLIHTAAEALRNYVRITYVDGSLGYGIA